MKRTICDGCGGLMPDRHGVELHLHARALDGAAPGVLNYDADLCKQCIDDLGPAIASSPALPTVLARFIIELHEMVSPLKPGMSAKERGAKTSAMYAEQAARKAARKV